MMQFALKKPNGVLWAGQYSTSEIDERLANAQIDETWLICPLGRADQAIEVRQFMQDRDVFAGMARKESETRIAENAIRESVPKPNALKWGQRLIGIALVYAVIGRAIVSVFFADLVNKEFGPIQLTMLIPFWAIGIFGLLAWIFGIFQHKMRIGAAVRKLRFDAATNGDINRVRATIADGPPHTT